ncbi:hypothetical protein [Chryseobacterium indoltheticum]|uniref:hypothetical protein n=1 Tax=Chryseobacterium indoltheticum TaxID=254 RepID=UPI003F4936D7
MHCLFRISGDTNNNAADFATGAPSPQNSSGATLGVSDVKNVKLSFIKNTLVKNNKIVFGEKSKSYTNLWDVWSISKNNWFFKI